MLKPTMLKQPVRKEQEYEEDRGEKAPVLLAVRTGLVLLMGRLGKAGRGYALAGAGVVAAALVAVSLLSWLAPDSDRPIASPLEAVGRVAGEVMEQVDDQVQALLGTDGEKTILRSVREGIATVSSVTPWSSGKSVEVESGPSASPGDSSSLATPTRGGGYSSSASDEAPSTSQPASSSEPSSSSPGTSEAPANATTEAPSSSPTEGSEPSSPPPSTEAPPPTTEEPSPPPPAQEPPAAEEPAPPPSAEEPPPAAEEPAPPPSVEEPPPAAEEPAPPPSAEEPPPQEGPPGTSADE